jgi:hypothetical protein
MATITIVHDKNKDLYRSKFIGIGKVEKAYWDEKTKATVLVIPRMSPTRFENVVKRVLTKNLTEQGITPIEITYSE